MHRHTCRIYMCKIKSVKNEMLNSSYKNNVNELFLRRMYTHTTVRTCTSYKSVLCLIYYMHIFYTFLFTLHRISVEHLSFKFVFFILFYFIFLLVRTLGGFKFNEMRKLHSAYTHVFKFYITNRNECICIHLIAFIVSV